MRAGEHHDIGRDAAVIAKAGRDLGEDLRIGDGCPRNLGLGKSCESRRADEIDAAAGREAAMSSCV